MGAIFLDEIEDIDSGLYYSTKALPLILAAKDSTKLAKCFNNIAVAYHKKNKLGEALSYYQKSVVINIIMKNYHATLLSSCNIAQIYCDQKQYERAIAQANQVLEQFVTKEFGSIRADLHLVMARSYLHTSQPDSAEKYFEQFFTLIYELNQTEQHKIIADVNTKYETEQKEKDILLLEENAELQIKESKFKQFIIYCFIGFSILLIFTIYLSVKSYLNKKKDNKIITIQKKEVERQKELVEVHQKEIMDSINYAKRIQYSLLAPENILNQNLNSYFVLFHPKDVVSGDFYWATEQNNSFYLATCDCTGHGVPGAFMSLLNIGFLNEAIKEKNISTPDEVFNFTRSRLIDSVGREAQQDGMDGILLRIDKKTNSLTYAAANNAPVLVRDNAIISLPKDKMPVGKGEKTTPFTLFTIDYQQGDTLYFFTDGYADQFGGSPYTVNGSTGLSTLQGKKFKIKQLLQLLLTINSLPLNEQKNTLLQNFNNWKGQLEQVDDVCVIGVKL